MKTDKKMSEEMIQKNPIEPKNSHSVEEKIKGSNFQIFQNFVQNSDRKTLHCRKQNKCFEHQSSWSIDFSNKRYFFTSLEGLVFYFFGTLAPIYVF
jgi:hypothetical protein